MGDMIDGFLDSDGWGTLTDELRRIFIANGCDPACHICDSGIKVDERFHLKPFYHGPGSVEGEDTTVQVMICATCSRTNRKLPRNEAKRVLQSAIGSDADLDAHKLSRTVMPPPKPRPTTLGDYGNYQRGGCFLVNGKIDA
jgi:hypothetical protein